MCKNLRTIQSQEGMKRDRNVPGCKYSSWKPFVFLQLYGFFSFLAPSATAAATASGVRMVVSPADSPDGSPVPL